MFNDVFKAKFSAKSWKSHSTHNSHLIDLSENVSRSNCEHSTLMLNAQGQGLDHVFLESNAHVTLLSLDII